MTLSAEYIQYMYIELYLSIILIYICVCTHEHVHCLPHLLSAHGVISHVFSYLHVVYMYIVQFIYGVHVYACVFCIFVSSQSCTLHFFIPTSLSDFPVTLLEYSGPLDSLSSQDVDQKLVNSRLEECSVCVDTSVMRLVETVMSSSKTRCQRDLGRHQETYWYSTTLYECSTFWASRSEPF